MKHKLILILILIIVIIFLIPKESNELRIRVIANSDTNYDQSIKLDVVKVLKKEISKFNQKDIINEVKSNINLLDEKVSNVLKNRPYTLKIDNVRFPTKEINGEIIPGGKYQTLLVVIGEGKGKNWWSLLYPNYHNISFEDLETGEVEFKFYILEELKKSFSNKK